MHIEQKPEKRKPEKREVHHSVISAGVAEIPAEAAAKGERVTVISLKESSKRVERVSTIVEAILAEV